jgi:High potential iron-sulfur protein
MGSRLDESPNELSRRSMLLQGLACASVVSVAFAASTDAAMAAKLPQTAVSYRNSPNAGKKCSECALFEPPNACKNVAGDISPEGWCLLWRTK